jgi:DNA-binding response OmpR family regulator
VQQRAENPLQRIVVVDDDDIVTSTLRLYLESAGFAVATARDGVRALELASAEGTALVILDLMIPGLTGQEVCQRIREKSSVPIMMLTARTLENERVEGLEMGADDYVPKPFSPREVVARVRALLRRSGGDTRAPPRDAFRIGALEIDRWRRQVRVAGHLLLLTPTELRILDALSRQPGRVFTREQLVGHAFGPDYEGLDRTVDTHVTNLRRKLAAHSDERYIVTVHGAGYRFASQDELQN